MNEAIPGLKIVELDLYENNNPVSALITDFPKDLALDFFWRRNGYARTNVTQKGCKQTIHIMG